MNYKIVSVGVLLLASTVAGLVLFTKNSEQVFKAPEGAIAKQDILKAPDPQTIRATLPTVTNQVAQSIAQDILNRNPQGPQPSKNLAGVSSITALDPKLVASKILEEDVQKATTAIFAGAPKSEEINQSSSASPAEYLKNRGEIIKAAQLRLAPYQGKKFTDATLTVMRDTIRSTLGAMNALQVPPSLISIHSEQVRLLKAQFAIFDNILNRDTDPVAASVSISLIQKVNEDLATLSRTIKAYIAQHSS